MTRSQTSTTKTRNSFEIHKSPKKRLAAIASQLATRHSNSKAATKQRLKAPLGSGRRFAGHIKIPPRDIASQDDTIRLKDVQTEIESGNEIVYWVDGSRRQGRLGAGVVWREGKIFKARYHVLGRVDGCTIGDAELFAIAAAMRRAKRVVPKGSATRLVRIYSDAQCVLRGLENGSCRRIGPFEAGSTALQELYDNTDWLVARNVRVELVWVKGHSASIDNQIADEAAGIGADAPTKSGISTTSKAAVQPEALEKIKEIAPVWTREWLGRMHRQPINLAFQYSIGGKNVLKRPDEAQETCEKLDKPVSPMVKKKTSSGSLILKKAEKVGGHRQTVDFPNTRIVTGRNPKVVFPAPHRQIAIPVSTLSVKKTYSKRASTPLPTAKTSKDIGLSQSAASKQTRLIKKTTRRSRCLTSLLTWGSTTAPCSTRLRTRSRLDSVGG